MKTTIVAFTLAFACLAGANNPADQSAPRKGGKTFTLNQIRNERSQGMDGPAAMIHAHVKHGIPLPPAVLKAIEINPALNARFKMFLTQQDPQSGTVEAQAAPMFDSEYVVPVEIGTPAQTIPLNLDTGSSDLWTFSTDTYAPQVNGQKLYHPYDSNSSKLLQGQSWKILYGDGAGASGIVYSDTVQLGGTSFNLQGVQSAVQVSADIAGDNFSSGILGMANSAANTVRPRRQLTYLDNIKDDLERPFFTANLKSQQVGNFNFGYLNNSEYMGSIKYVDIDKTTPFFKVTINGYKVGQNGTYKKDDWSGIVDTGTSLLLVPGRLVNDYYSKVPGAGIDVMSGMIVFPCSVDPPDFTFGIDSYRGVIPGRYIRYGNASPEFCYGGIQSSNAIEFAVMGDVMIKAQFVVFNYGSEPSVGFANKKLTS